MKKIIVILLGMFVLLFGIKIGAEEVRIPVYGTDDYLQYYQSTEYVTIPTEYTKPEKEFRAAWVSSYAGDIGPYTNEANFKKEMNQMLDILQYYNFNAVIYHVRTHNNAMYKSSLNPRGSYWTSVNFNVFDPLEWLIDECHRRGIEFHAWMNPYRVSVNGLNYCAEKYPSVNPASNPDNLISGRLDNNSVVILDPSKEAVKSFLVSTCMELIRNYDVDAIHFDDYFYIQDAQDDKSYQENNPQGLPKDEWRRNNIDDFIHRLSNQIKNYNNQNNKSVQLGISPSPVWKDGNGVVTYDENGNAITNGSHTANAGGHYGDHLYCDTLKWINNEWIDYIIPQVYHDFKTPAGFAERVDWWDAVVKYKKVNLYIGIGLYGPGTTWDDPNELQNQLLYMNKHENVKGFSIYSFSTLKSAYNKSKALKATQVEKAYNMSWNQKTLPTVLQRYDKYTAISKVDDLKIAKTEEGYQLSFVSQDDARFYVVYKNEGGKQEQLKITSGNKLNGRTYIDDVCSEGEYQYTIVPLSYSNIEGEPLSIFTNSLSIKVDFVDEEGNLLETKYAVDGKVEAPNIDVPKGFRVEYSHSLDNINESMEIVVRIVASKRDVTFEYLDSNGQTTTTTQEVDGDIVFPEVPEVPGKKFLEFERVDDNYYRAKYEQVVCHVEFLDKDGNTIKSLDVNYGDSITDLPKLEDYDIYQFVGWDFKNPITSDMKIKPIFEPIKFTVVFKNNLGDTLKTVEVEYGKTLEMIEVEKIKGYKFVGFFLNGEEIKGEIVVTSDLTITVQMEPTKGCNSGNILGWYTLVACLGLVFLIRKRKNN